MIEELLEKIDALTVAELAELVKAIEEKYIPDDKCCYQCFKQLLEYPVSGYYKVGKNVYDLVVPDSCDVEKYSEIFKDITSLQPEDTLQLVLEAKTEEERSFYEMIGDFLLQMKQKTVVERNLF